MIRLRAWLYRVFFGQQHVIEDLKARLLFATETLVTLRAEIVQKDAEIHALFDAMLIDKGRQPMYSEPVKVETAEMGSPEQLEASLKSAKGRNWSHTAAALEQLVNNRANGGVRG